MDAIIWAKQPDDTWLKTQDSFPAGVRWAKIRYGATVSAGSWRLKQAVQIVESAIETGKTGQHEEYVILPDKEHSEAMPEEVKVVLQKLKSPVSGPTADSKPEPNMTFILCSSEGCENQFPRARGRFPQKFCPEHRQ